MRGRVILFTFIGAVIALAATGAGLALLWAIANTDETPVGLVPESGWSITAMTIEYEIADDATVSVQERIEVDFNRLERHGIFRDLVTKTKCEASPPVDDATWQCPEGELREYLVDELRVTDERGRALETKVEQLGRVKRIRIGDPDRTVTGRQTYVINYRLRGALNPFENHDEFYWNATGHDWTVPIEEAQIEVRFPAGTEIDAAECFTGSFGSTDRCETEVEGERVVFRTGRLRFAEGATVLVALPKGEVEVPEPLLDDRLEPGDLFTFSPLELGLSAVTTVASLVAVGALWWQHGRDRRFTSIHYLTNDTQEETKPLFARDAVVVEFTPPGDLRPAQMGLLLDESADTLDISATIVDLAVRGYLTITEIPKEGFFGAKDWVLTEGKARDDGLLAYEETLLKALFDGRTDVRLSELRNTFAKTLDRAKKQLVDDGMRRHWFTQRPGNARGNWLAAGLGLMVAGALLSFALGYFGGHALVGLPVLVAGVVLFGVSPAMARRTAIGSEALRRVLGFREYVATAETRRQQFNEDRGILNQFARYLPFAMVFGCVERWAKALEGLADEAQLTSGWYYGYAGAFSANAFSSDMRGFASSVGSTLSSTPGGSGGSGGGGGGFSGGGGGGGGGGSW